MPRIWYYTRTVRDAAVALSRHTYPFAAHASGGTAGATAVYTIAKRRADDDVVAVRRPAEWHRRRLRGYASTRPDKLLGRDVLSSSFFRGPSCPGGGHVVSDTYPHTAPPTAITTADRTNHLPTA